MENPHLVSERTALASLIIELGERPGAQPAKLNESLRAWPMRPNPVHAFIYEKLVRPYGRHRQLWGMIAIIVVTLAIPLLIVFLMEFAPSTGNEPPYDSPWATLVGALFAPLNETTSSDSRPDYATLVGMLSVSLGVLTACLLFASTLYLSLWQSLTDSMATLVERIDNANRNAPCKAVDCLSVGLKEEAMKVGRHLTDVIGAMRGLFATGLWCIVIIWLLAIVVLLFLNTDWIYRCMIAALASVALVGLMYWVLIYAVQTVGPIPEKVQIQRALDYLLYDDRFRDPDLAGSLVECAKERCRQPRSVSEGIGIAMDQDRKMTATCRPSEKHSEWQVILTARRTYVARDDQPEG